MGEGIIRFYQEKVKKTWKIAFVSAFIIGLVVHMFRIVNVLPNHDALYNFYSSQNMVATGRWFLSVACAPSSYFDLPWMIGVLCLLYMSLTAVVITEIFEMRNPVLIALCSGMLVSFPAITDTMFFGFTADGYLLAMLLASISVLLTKIGGFSALTYRRYIANCMAVLCICLACAIYQAYISFAYVLAVCYFMLELLENRYSKQEYIKWIITQVTVYIVAIIGYYVLWQLAMKLQNVAPTSYRDINQVMNHDKYDLISNVVRCIKNFVKFFVEWNVFELGLTPYTALNMLIIGFALVGVVKAVILSGCIKRIGHMVLIALCLASMPFVCCIFCLTSEIGYSPRMMQSVCAIYIFIAILYERWLKPNYKNLILTVLTVFILNNCVTANIFYKYMHQCYEVSYAMAVEMSTRIHLHDTGNEKNIAIIGWIPGYDDYAKTDESQLGSLGSLKDVNRILTTSHRNIALFLYYNLDFELSYYKINNVPVPEADLGKTPPVPDGWYFCFPIANDSENLHIELLDEVKLMPCWPAAGSVKTIGDTIVVKLSEIE